VIAEIESRNHVPILVGGTGFYLRALRQPFFPSPTTDESLRKRLNETRQGKGAEYLHKLLRRIDPVAANQLAARDWPRVQRAIEVCLQTGTPFSAQKQLRPPTPQETLRLRVIALNPPRTELYERINGRTEKHFNAGLVEEVKQLLSAGVPADSNALGAHGYRRVVEYLRGERDLASAIEQTKLDVRHYAKRQMTWFRREPSVEWFEGFGEDPGLQRRILNTFVNPTAVKTA
jgi:tRNA dimethylallyltransferase